MDISTVMTWTVSLCHLCYIFAPSAVQHPLPNPSSWPFLLPALSLSFILPLLIASQPLSLSCFILFSLLFAAPHWDRGQGAPEGPMCVFMWGEQETAEEDLSGWTGRAPRCELGEGDRQGGVALLWDTVSPMVWQGQLLLRATVAFWAHLLRESTVQPGEPSAVWRYRSWGGCKKKFAFLVKISHLHLDSHASNIFPFSSITYLWCFDTGIWLLEPVIWLPKVFLSVIIIILTTHPPKNLWLVHFCYFSSSPF